MTKFGSVRSGLISLILFAKRVTLLSNNTKTGAILSDAMSATWTVIPWSILKDLTMTYGELREVLMCMDEKHLHQTVTLYCLEEDEFVPAIGTDYTDEECQTIDPDHLVISF